MGTAADIKKAEDDAAIAVAKAQADAASATASAASSKKTLVYGAVAVGGILLVVIVMKLLKK